MNKEIRGLKNWIQHISQMEMPSLANVLRDLAKLADNSESNIQDLSEVILKDTSLTSQVIRVANSAQYNPSGQSVATVSKAIINIGFNEVRSIGLSASVIDGLLSKNTNNALLAIMGQSFHAATQAKNMAFDQSPDVREEIFVATLLLNLGEMAFLACNLSQVQDYIEKVAENPKQVREIGREINGIGFGSITKGLAKEWNLGSLLQSVLNNPDKTDMKQIPIFLGDRLSREIGRGWKSVEVRQIVAEIGQFTGLSEKETKELILKGADATMAAARIYGAEKISDFIPTRSALEAKNRIRQTGKTQIEIQMAYLQELTQLAMDHANINQILSKSVEALHVGLKLKRPVIMLINTERTHVIARYVGDTRLDHWTKVFRMPVTEDNPEPRDLFSIVATRKTAQWLDDSEASRALRYDPLAHFLPTGHCFAAPLLANSRLIGVVYADSEGEALSESQFKQFQLFTNQANLAVALLSQ